ncbi:hypothetical protein QUC31_019553 [Theobroma cacao]|uniref:EF-hand domain-containing protein 1, putative n=1 Tax=Theobroma cacao TaxID=3641 RepID=A0A061GQF4_THECC|nr:EF-hand domain-containing protein 1, putative [Theobroma cacao]
MGLCGKLKRKDIDQVNDDFSDFSLSSPATKIRRLDAELPPIIEEEESFTENQDKAIVLFNPLLRSPSALSLSLNSDLISGFKNQFLRASHMKSADFGETKTEQSSKATEGCLAVVPWIPCQIPAVESRDGQLELPESMEADEMDIENNIINNNGNSNNARMEQELAYEYGGLKPSETLHHWPQQHCMIHQPPQNPFTPVTWSQ